MVIEVLTVLAVYEWKAKDVNAMTGMCCCDVARQVTMMQVS